MDMILHYLGTALRYLKRQRLHALLNVAGLATGLCCCLIIALFVVQELSFDRHYANAERLYRVGRLLEGNEISENNSVLAAPLLRQDFAEVEQAAGFVDSGTEPVLMARNDAAFFEEGIAFADADFFQLFDFQWLHGDPSSALAQPGSIVLTQTLATKYFGNAKVLGETLLMDDSRPLQVTGVVADLPVATHLRSNAFVSMDVFRQRYAEQGFDIGVWNFAAVSTYVLLHEGVAMDALESRFTDFVARHVPPGTTRVVGLTATPLTDIHLQTNTDASIGPVGRLVIFSSIAICILLIAAINFVNFATAHASLRMLEVGLRKSMGASRGQLVQQFLGETSLMILLASVVALGLTELLLPGINAALGLELAMSILVAPAMLAGLCGVIVTLVLAAGIYPAFYLSGFKPVLAFDGKAAGGKSGLLFRNVLVILQFSIAIALLITSVVVLLQMRMVNGLDTGYERDRIVEFSLPPDDTFDLNMQWSGFATRLLQDTGVDAVTHSLSSPLLPSRLEISIGWEGDDATSELVLMLADHGFFATYGIPVVAGRAFSADVSLDKAQRFDSQDPDRLLGNVLLNEAGAEKLGWTAEEAIGQFVRLGNGARYAVIGVVADTVPSVREGPVGMFFMSPSVFAYPFGGGSGAVRISGTNVEATLAHIDTVWREFSPGEPIRRQFVSEQVNALYQDERMQGRLFSYATFFAVAIACSGLLGLAAFSAERRTREIGVRKVMGGSVWSIVLLLTNDFSKLVLLSNLIAWPVAYFAMARWLENFAYRIDLTPLVFIGSGLIALCIAWVTVGGTAAKAANAKPVLALRYE